MLNALKPVAQKLRIIFGKKPALPKPEYAHEHEDEPLQYQVMRGGVVSSKIASEDEIAEILASCGMLPDTMTYVAALSGVPFSVEGQVMRFIRVSGGR
jgi:hypothetical protein